MDIVYTLGTGSQWSNNEIRYSLRSIQKHLHGYHDIFIIGEDPGFLNEKVTIIPYPDHSSYNKEKNIFDKILHACEQPQISDDFLFINDDHFFLKTFDVNHLPCYQRGCLKPAFEKRKAGDPYRVSLKNTFTALKAKNKNTYHFDVHFPIVYNKKKFQYLQHAYDWTIPYGYVIKSLYSNTWQIQGDHYDDIKLTKKLLVPELQELCYGKDLLSIGDSAVNPELKAWFNHLYPQKTVWEN
jgi:hypothetical protein